jgi:ubiquinone/menaquinone biosynthesis C-methylase UbiE
LPEPPAKESLAIDVEELRRKLGPVKVALIDLWIREVNGPYDALIARYIHPEAIVLDVGCSRGDPDLPSMTKARLCIGADLDILGLRANTIDHACIMAPMGALPFADNTFDVIVCKWVVEHLADPAKDFAEARRVLKPGGALVILTPNAHSLFTLISRSMSYRVKQILKGKMFETHEEDTFRTYYRANSVGRLSSLLRDAGFRRADLQVLPGMFTFFIFSGPLARLVRQLEWMQHRIPVLRNFCTYLVGAWEKEGT